MFSLFQEQVKLLIPSYKTFYLNVKILIHWQINEKFIQPFAAHTFMQPDNRYIH